MMFFFFQAEDGIRDADVTGVQTCALPIFNVFACQHPHSDNTQGSGKAIQPRNVTVGILDK